VLGREAALARDVDDQQRLSAITAERLLLSLDGLGREIVDVHACLRSERRPSRSVADRGSRSCSIGQACVDRFRSRAACSLSAILSQRRLNMRPSILSVLLLLVFA